MCAVCHSTLCSNAIALHRSRLNCSKSAHFCQPHACVCVCVCVCVCLCTHFCVRSTTRNVCMVQWISHCNTHTHTHTHTHARRPLEPVPSTLCSTTAFISFWQSVSNSVQSIFLHHSSSKISRALCLYLPHRRRLPKRPFTSLETMIGMIG